MWPPDLRLLVSSAGQLACTLLTVMHLFGMHVKLGYNQAACCAHSSDMRQPQRKICTKQMWLPLTVSTGQ
jgi:hypothetical protein